MTTATVQFSSGGTSVRAYQARPEREGRRPAVLICHENRGLAPHIEDVAGRFAKAGCAAGSPGRRPPDTGDRYNEAQATAAWNDTLAWFGRHL
jgi:dienelactone hydrolase